MPTVMRGGGGVMLDDVARRTSSHARQLQSIVEQDFGIFLMRGTPAGTPAAAWSRFTTKGISSSSGITGLRPSSTALILLLPLPLLLPLLLPLPPQLPPPHL